MSNIIPPLLSDSPPPPPSPDEEDDDEFGDFAGAIDCSYTCDNFSLPQTPEHSPAGKLPIPNGFDINYNDEEDTDIIDEIQQAKAVEKDFHDKRKKVDTESLAFTFDCAAKKQFQQLQLGNNLDCSVNNQNTEIVEDIKNKHTLEGDLELNELEEPSSNEATIHEDVNEKASTIVINNPSEMKMVVSDIVQDESIEIRDTNVTLESSIHLDQPIIEKCEEKQEIFSTNTNATDIGDICPVSTVIPEDDEISNQIREDLEFLHISNNTPAVIESNDNADDEDFGDFENAVVENFGHINDIVNVKPAEIESSLQSCTDEAEKVVIESEDEDDEFGEFNECSSAAVKVEISESSASKEESAPNFEDDDFGDFSTAFEGNNSITTTYCEPVFLLMNEKEAYEKAKQILVEMFLPCEAIEVEDYCNISPEKDDKIFNQLRDITETAALHYQWSKSNCQKTLLKSLNIDARNILYGPSWNPSMPRFAANLSLEPLEPVKSGSFQKSSPTADNPSSQQVSVDVPSVNFDWTSSGLTNPLDSIPKESSSDASQNPKSSTSLPTETSHPAVASSPSKEPEKNTTENVKPIVATSEDNEDDFAPFQSSFVAAPQTSQWSNTVVPLRETYITSSETATCIIKASSLVNTDSWLQPTVIPASSTDPTSSSSFEKLDEADNFENYTIQPSGEEEGPSKVDDFSAKVKETSVISSHTKENPDESIGRESIPDEDDEFTDFQFSTPSNQTSIPSASTSTKTLMAEPLKPAVETLKQSKLETKLKPITNSQVLISKEESSFILSPKPVQEAMKPISITDNPHQSLINDATSTGPLKPVQNETMKPVLILEPLKPTPVAPSKATAARINWPEPGVTEEDLKKFDKVFSHQHQKAPVMHSKNNNKSQSVSNSRKEETVNDNGGDDDEWTDFISVKKSSPVHKLKAREERSSPDLPLSVFNLGSIQPAKQPIPVITPQGLVQTKLSSSSSSLNNAGNNVNLSPKTTLKTNSNSVISPRPTYAMPPSIISQQYATQAYGFNNIQYGRSAAMNQHQKADDDDWGEFVSSPLPAASSSQASYNGYSHPPQRPQHPSSSSSMPSSYFHNSSSWTGTPTNIITNPHHHFTPPHGGSGSFSSSSANRVSQPTNMNRKMSNNALSHHLVMPELDFIAPRAKATSRTSSTSKKK